MTGMVRDSVPSRALEMLALDGGWLTTDGLWADLPEVERELLRRGLHRLRKRGLVVSRVRESNWPGQPSTEWAAS